jgi:hypothetical protein
VYIFISKKECTIISFTKIQEHKNRVKKCR